jgi:hypothetical protein
MESPRDESEKVDDSRLQRHTDPAREKCAGDWRVHTQSDEVLHEGGIPAIWTRGGEPFIKGAGIWRRSSRK